MSFCMGLGGATVNNMDAVVKLVDDSNGEICCGTCRR